MAVALFFCVAMDSFGQQISVRSGSHVSYPMYSKWFAEYHKTHPNVQVGYQSVGSGLGIRRVSDGEVYFGASDAPLNDLQITVVRQPPGLDCPALPDRCGRRSAGV